MTSYIRLKRIPSTTSAEAIAFRGMRKTLEITDKLMIEIQPDSEWLIDELKSIGFNLIDKKEINYFFTKLKLGNLGIAIMYLSYL